MNRIIVRDYTTEDQIYFEKFNREWIEQYFELEEIDIEVLQHPERSILKKGGTILIAEYNDVIAGTVALKPVDEKMFEFTKMAVTLQFQGKGLGRALSIKAIERAIQLGAASIILYSNRKLEAAIELYRKLGFYEIPVDATYKRSDIKMRLNLTQSSD